MLNRLKLTLLTLTSLFSFAAPLAFATAPVAAQACDDVSASRIEECLAQGGCASTTSIDCVSDAQGDVNKVIKLVINLFSIIVGIISVVMIIIGGLKYITSGGDSGNVTGAKNTILYAVIGLVVVALAQIIVRFVLSKVTSTTGEATGL